MSNMKATEKVLQAAVMAWAMNEKRHRVVVPNSTLFGWEADLFSVTSAGLVHEYEMKCTMADYKRDADKYKHAFLQRGVSSPAYFWYVTADFDIEPPQHAGWIVVQHDETLGQWAVEVKKDAPRLAGGKLEKRQEESIVRLLSWQVMKLYQRFFNEPDGGKRPIHTATYQRLRWELDEANRAKERRDQRIAELEEGYKRSMAHAAKEARISRLEKEKTKAEARIAKLEEEKRDLLALMAADNARLAELEGRVVFRDASAAGVTIRPEDEDMSPAASFRRSWEDMLAGRVRAVDDLWDGLEGLPDDKTE